MRWKASNLPPRRQGPGRSEAYRNPSSGYQPEVGPVSLPCLDTYSQLPMLKNKNGRLTDTWVTIKRRASKLPALLKSIWVVISGRWPVKPAGAGRPTKVAFLCHIPALWSKLEPVYLELRDSADFEPIVISAHRDVETRRETARFLTSKGVRVVGGSGEPFTDLQALKPDYVFHSVPYENFYPDQLKPAVVHRYARLCYVPYVGQLIYSSGVAETTHHSDYFKLLRLAFLADEWEKRRLMKNLVWYGYRKGIKVVGSPHAERVAEIAECITSRVSRRPQVLWTPRWNSAEGNCHFFDHKNLLLEMSEKGEIDFTFRPHPLCLAHFLKSGELTQAEHDTYLGRIAQCAHAKLDVGDYMQALKNHEIFVSDMSSVLGDAFLTGKPVVYTHRVDHFNELGRFMAEGFYWVRTPAELSMRLRSLAAGDDPLQGKREELLKAFHARQPRGAARRILEHIRSDRICD